MQDELIERLKSIAEASRRESDDTLPPLGEYLTEAATQGTADNARIAELEAAHKLLRDAYDDAVGGLRYIEVHYGKLGGVGWQRVYDAFEALVTIPEREGLLAGSALLERTEHAT